MKNQIKEEAILKGAAKLFAERGYNGVTLEDVAQKLGVNDKHVTKLYPAKGFLRNAVYDRYKKLHEAAAPNLDDVLRVAETEHPHKALMLLEYKLPPEEGEFLRHTFISALQDFHSNKASRDLIRSNTIGSALQNTKTVLDYLIELDRIEPVSVSGLAKVVAYCGFTCSVFDKIMTEAALNEFGMMLQMLTTLVKPKNKTV